MSQTAVIHHQNKRVKSAHNPSRRRRINGGGDGTSNLDRPSANLPGNIVTNIFSYLPIKQAVRNSAVSRSFRRSWVYNRCFIFDQAFARRVSTRDELINIVNGVFGAHIGPQILKLHLYLDPTQVEATVHSWLEKAIAKGVEELDLDFFVALETFDFPSHFLDIQTLRKLKLCYCNVQFPVDPISGLRFLTTVAFKKVFLDDGFIEKLVDHCLGLESLDLAQCHGPLSLTIWASRLKSLRIGGCTELTEIEIDAPSLVTFYYHGHCRCLNLKCTVENLDDVVLNLIPSRSFAQCYDIVERLAFFHLKSVTVLTATSTLLEGFPVRLSEGDRIITTDYHPILWNKLKELQLSMEPTSYCNLTDVASFLGGCRNLENLFIDLNDYNFVSGIFWDLHQNRVAESYTMLFPRLKFVKMRGFRFQSHEMGLVRFLLQRSLNLEEMVFVFPKNDDCEEITLADVLLYERMFKSWTLSKDVNFSVCEHVYDKKTSCPKHSKVWY